MIALRLSPTQTYVPANAVDGNTSTCWEATNGGWPSTTFTTLVGSVTYTWNPSTGNTVTIPLPTGTSDQYLQLSFTANNVQNGAQASEIQIFG